MSPPGQLTNNYDKSTSTKDLFKNNKINFNLNPLSVNSVQGDHIVYEDQIVAYRAVHKSKYGKLRNPSSKVCNIAATSVSPDDLTSYKEPIPAADPGAPIIKHANPLEGNRNKLQQRKEYRNEHRHRLLNQQVHTLNINRGQFTGMATHQRQQWFGKSSGRVFTLERPTKSDQGNYNHEFFRKHPSNSRTGDWLNYLILFTKQCVLRRHCHAEAGPTQCT